MGFNSGFKGLMTINKYQTDDIPLTCPYPSSMYRLASLAVASLSL